jgi:hypothetical protein
VATTDAQASFAINLADNTSGAAASAAKALETLRGQIDGDTKALAAMQRAMKNLQGGTVVNVKQFKELQAGILSKKSAIAEAQSSFLSLGGSFAKTGGASRGLETRFAAMIRQAHGLPGPLGGLVSKFEALKIAVGGGAIALGLVAIAAGLVLLVGATAAAVASLYRYGVAQADAGRSELLRLEGLTKLRNYWGVAAGNATQMQDAIDQVSASSALGRDKIAAYSDQLYKMNLRGENLTAALEGMAIKASVQGDAQASMFGQWAAGANMTGQSVRRLAGDVKARLGGIASAQMLSLTVQSEKLHESFNALFNDLKIEPFLKTQAQVKGLLSQNLNSGKAVKQILTTMLQPLVNAATAAQPYLRRFFNGIIIGALHIEIALLQVRNWFRKAFNSPDVFKDMDTTKIALYAGEAAAFLLAGGLAAASMAAVGLGLKLATYLVPALWRVVAATAEIAISGLVIAAPFLLAAAAILAVVNTGRLLYLLWKEIDWTGLGTSIWKGIVGGLKSGATYVLDAVKSLGSSAWAAFKNKLGIASPSKAFARLGLAIPMGVGAGIAAGTPHVQQALGRMVAPQLRMPSMPPEGRGAGAARAQAAGPSIEIGEIHIHAASSEPRQMALDFKAELGRVLERVAIQMGSSAAPEPV